MKVLTIFILSKIFIFQLIIVILRLTHPIIWILVIIFSLLFLFHPQLNIISNYWKVFKLVLIEIKSIFIGLLNTRPIFINTFPGNFFNFSPSTITFNLFHSLITWIRISRFLLILQAFFINTYNFHDLPYRFASPSLTSSSYGNFIVFIYLQIINLERYRLTNFN